LKSELQKTNFGLISKNWKLIPFEEIMLNLQNGLYKSKEFVGKGTKIVKMGNQYGHPRIYEQEGMDRYDLSNDELKKHQLEFDDLLFSRRSLIFDGAGECSIVKEKHIPLVIESSIIRVILNKDIAVPDFYFYFFQSHLGKQLIRSINQGTSISGITGSDLKKIQVPLPSILEQKSIINSFLKIDDLLENIQNQNHILEQTTQAIFKSWFVDFDGVTEFEDSELGKIPQGWSVKKIGDVIELLYGKSLTKENRVHGNIPVYGSSGIVGFHNQSLSTKKGIIVGRKGNVGSVYLSSNSFYAIDTAYYVKTELSLHYVYRNFQNQNFINSDSSVPGLSRDQAYSLPILIPKNVILEKFENISSKIQIILEKNKNLILTLTKTRDTLLPKLMSGEIRV